MARKAELKAVLTLNNKPFINGLKTAMTGAKRFAAQTRGLAVDGIGKAAAIGFKASSAASLVAGAAMAAFSVKSIGAAANMEDLKTSFEVMLGSASKAGARMK